MGKGTLKDGGKTLDRSDPVSEVSESEALTKTQEMMSEIQNFMGQLDELDEEEQNAMQDSMNSMDGKRKRLASANDDAVSAPHVPKPPKRQKGGFNVLGVRSARCVPSPHPPLVCNLFQRPCHTNTLRFPCSGDSASEGRNAPQSRPDHPCDVGPVGAAAGKHSAICSHIVPSIACCA
jgi:hypothetical protein